MGKRYLLDTHALIWATYEPRRLGRMAKALLSDGEGVLVSAASAYEVSFKYRLGKLDFAAPLALDFVGETEKDGYTVLPLSAHHAQRAGLLATSHRDLFDRMLIAQAMVENLVLVSNEAMFDASGVERLW